MNKDEILQKSRAEGKDEGISFVARDALLAGSAAMLLLLFVFRCANLYFGIKRFDLDALYNISFGIGALRAYKLRQKKVLLLPGIGFLVSAFLNCIRYILQIAG